MDTNTPLAIQRHWAKPTRALSVRRFGSREKIFKSERTWNGCRLLRKEREASGVIERPSASGHKQTLKEFGSHQKKTPGHCPGLYCLNWRVIQNQNL